MNLETLRDYCLQKKATTEEFPFDDVTLVFKVMGKMFAIIALDREDPFVNLKCDPERAILLRDEFPDITPGYHMNKEHWNSVFLDRSLTDELIRDLIDHSYELIIDSLPKKKKEIFKALLS